MINKCLLDLSAGCAYAHVTSGMSLLVCAEHQLKPTSSLLQQAGPWSSVIADGRALTAVAAVAASSVGQLCGFKCMHTCLVHTCNRNNMLGLYDGHKVPYQGCAAANAVSRVHTLHVHVARCVRTQRAAWLHCASFQKRCNIQLSQSTMVNHTQHVAQATLHIHMHWHLDSGMRLSVQKASVLRLVWFNKRSNVLPSCKR